jgi:hypothetical protein
MFGLNYTGLQKRDTYDEIVQLIESGGGKIKYPNRQATQILNSPFMKQINSASLMEIEHQQSELQQQQMKSLILQQISGMTGIPHFRLRAEPRQHTSVVAAVDSDMAANEARESEIEGLRGALDEYRQAYHDEKQARAALIARTTRETHERGTEAPMAHEMAMARIHGETQTHAPIEVALASAESQTSIDTQDRRTQTPVYRPEEWSAEFAQQAEELERQKAFLARERRLLEQHKGYVKTKVDEYEAAQVGKVSLGRAFSAFADMASGIGGMFGGKGDGKGAASSSGPPQQRASQRVRAREREMRGWWHEGEVAKGVVGGSNPVRYSMATPRDDKNKPAKSERSNTRTASRMMSEGGLVLSSLKGESAKNEDAKSEALREAIKKGKVVGSGSNGSVASGMARPVGTTPAPSHGSVISEPVSARSPPSGYAQPVGVGSGRSTPSALRSGASQSIGSAEPASTGASKRGSRANSAQTVNSSSHAGSARTRQRRG